MAWQVEIERKAQKALKKIPDPYKSNIIEAIDELSSDAQPHGSKKLKGSSDLYRIRVNAYWMAVTTNLSPHCESFT